MRCLNPQTGPFYVAGAEPRDALAINIGQGWQLLSRHPERAHFGQGWQLLSRHPERAHFGHISLDLG
jgi:acetamidase/formamidase